MADGRKFRDLKVRLGPGRRCFAFMHPSMPGEPLIFVDVALVPRLVGMLQLPLQLSISESPQTQRAVVCSRDGHLRPYIRPAKKGNGLLSGSPTTSHRELKRLRPAGGGTLAP